MLLGLYTFSQHTKEGETPWLQNFLPLFGGLLVSWLYNNAFQTSTFWFLITLLALTFSFAKQRNDDIMICPDSYRD
jgi:hypothetical protein